MNRILLGNIISFAGALLMVAIGFLKRRRDILLAQSAQFVLMGVGNLVLGGLTGAAANALSIVRNLFCLKRQLTVPLALALAAVQAALTVGLNDRGWIGWLPVAATVSYTLVINADAPVLKAASVFGQLCWAVYDLTMRNYASFAFDVLTVLSNLWGILVLGREKRRAGDDVSDRGAAGFAGKCKRTKFR